MQRYATQFDDFCHLRIKFLPAFLRRQCLQHTTLALLAPFLHVRRVAPFPLQQGADVAPLGAGIDPGPNALLVLGAEPPQFRLRYDL